MKTNSNRRLSIGLAVFFILIGLGCAFFYKEVFARFFPPPPLPPPPPVVVSKEPTPSAFQPLETFHFEDASSLKAWEQKVFKGETHYEVLKDEWGGYLHARSDNSSCGLFMKTRHEAAPGLFLHWKWRAIAFPEKKDPTKLSSRTSDDFSARVYVIFEASNLFRSNVIEYVWDKDLPVGKAEDSPYSDRIKLLVIRSGPSSGKDGWQEETRNPLEDYVRLFGKPPKYAVGIVALMCDSDNTGTSAEADFGDVSFGTLKKNNENGGGA